MQLGVDFDGITIQYALCAASQGGDGHIFATTDNLEDARREIERRIQREKKKTCPADVKFWIVKQIHTFVKIYDVDLENKGINQ